MATTTNFGWETPDDTDLVKDGALAMRTLGNSIDTSFVDLKGGTTGQNLRKASNTDLDFTWAGDATNTVVDAAGDLLYGTAADTLGRLAIGTSGQVLTVAGGVPTWATPAGGGGGKVLQVVSGASSGYIAITTSNTYGDTNLSLSITPTLATSKILILVTQMLGSYQNSASIMNKAFARIMRGATAIWTSDATSSNGKVWTSGAYADTTHNTLTFHYLDSPATTSATTYKTQFKQADNSNDHTLYMNYGDFPSQITLMEIGA